MYRRVAIHGDPVNNRNIHGDLVNSRTTLTLCQ
ncbi:hypothetical protein SAMN06273570_0219 [Candidatus Pantoea floridensis]|uniref:Uncharacterized protein n=1 Tax=Candidatus Pantoea floridensis TaxID=1938870 RepID=A0A286BMH3_9GAMM|nr:hypothetical protein BX596_1896 [Enterobacteriaceae bacterium JKS000233]SOD35332.1 hypothetical protein SAMN06273570_0219 [Pantoea floridensis]